MSKSDAATSSIFATKAQHQKRQSFLKRLASAPVPSKSSSILSPPPSPPPPTTEKQPMSRLQSVRLTLIASVSRRRTRCSSTASSSQPSESPVNKKPKERRTPTTKKRDRVDTLYAPPRLPVAPRRQQRPMSQQQTHEDIIEEPLPPWRRSLPSSATTMALHSRIVSRQSSMSSSSSSSSSVRTVTHDPAKSRFLSKLYKAMDATQPNNALMCNKQPVTPMVSCSSMYPSFETRGPTPMASLSSEIITKKQPVRARTMFAVIGSVQKKEVKAISVWRNTVSKLLLSDETDQSDPTSKTTKDRALCKFIVNEMYTTEQSYHRLLKLIQTRYMQPMIAASQQSTALVKEEDIPVLFKHLPEMLGLSEKILQCFQGHKQWVRVGRMFQMLEQEMVVFLKYAVHYEAHSKLIRRACNNVLFLKIEQESLTRKETNRMGIADYFIAPFQRVPRYCLLIKDLMRHMDRADPQFAELDVALKMLTGLTVAMDHVQKIPR